MARTKRTPKGLSCPTVKKTKIVEPFKGNSCGGTRTKAGNNASRKIRFYQKPLEYLICKAAFARVVHGIMAEFGPGMKFQANALDTLQEVTEVVATYEFEVANLLAIHANRVTIMQRDMLLAKMIRKEYFHSNSFL